MSNDLNQCLFIGRLGRDPETRYIPSGDAVTSFSIAVGWKSRDREGTEWVNVVTFGKLAEICGEYLKKGSHVFVSGRMKTEEYEKDGIKKYSTKIVADRMQMLGGRSQNDANEATEDRQEKQGPSYNDIPDSDIPF